MIKRIIVIMTVLLIIPLAYAANGENPWPICKDSSAPDAPGSLNSDVNDDRDVQLTWKVANDEPDCSGIDYYMVTRDDIFVDRTTSTSFSEGPMAYATYTYKVWAVDLGGNSGDVATRTVTVSKDSGDSGGSSGGGGGSYISTTTNTTGDANCTPNWLCSAWGECEDGVEERTCVDENNCGTEEDKPQEKQECTKTTLMSTINPLKSDSPEEGNSTSGNEASDDDETKGGLAGITGRFLGGNSRTGVGIAALLVIIIGGLLLYAYFKPNK